MITYNFYSSKSTPVCHRISNYPLPITLAVIFPRTFVPTSIEAVAEHTRVTHSPFPNEDKIADSMHSWSSFQQLESPLPLFDYYLPDFKFNVLTNSYFQPHRSSLVLHLVHRVATFCTFLRSPNDRQVSAPVLCKFSTQFPTTLWFYIRKSQVSRIPAKKRRMRDSKIHANTLNLKRNREFNRNALNQKSTRFFSRDSSNSNDSNSSNLTNSTEVLDLSRGVKRFIGDC